MPKNMNIEDQKKIYKFMCNKINDYISKPLTVKILDDILNTYQEEVIINNIIIHPLENKENILNFLKNNIKKNKDLENKIKILSYGVHGVILEPAINIINYSSITLDYNYVSKIIDSKKEKDKYLNREQEISLILKKIDPLNKNFLYPISCKKFLSFTNFKIKKGYLIDLYEEKLTEQYLILFFLNIIKSIKILKNNKILNLDIKSDNVLLKKNSNNAFNLVMIDFSGELVVKTKKELAEFIENFKFYIHPYWSFEFNKILYNEGVNYNPKYNKKRDKLFEKYSEIIEKDILNSFYDNIYPNVVYDLQNNIEIFYEKQMVYQVGKTFQYLTESYFPNSTNNLLIRFNKLLDTLVNENYNKRPRINEITNMINVSIKDYKIKF